MFVSAFRAPFIQDDLDYLSKQYHVRTRIGSGFAQILGIIFNVFKSDVVFCWFASVYAGVAVFISNIVSSRSIIVVGGVDAAKDKELNYGIWLSPWKSRFVRYAFRHADHILVVDPSLKEEATRLAEYDGRNISYVPTGYDHSFWKPMGEKEQIVVTVAVVRNEVTMRRKGIDTLIAAARRLPQFSFIIVGIESSIQKKLGVPENVTMIEPIYREEVLPYYQRAKVYCQPSRREGLPNALCEAMLCGCVPVATGVNGNPTAVGDTGFLSPAGDAEALAAGIVRAMADEEQAGEKARTRIISLFPRQKRETELTRFIEGNRL